MSSNFSKFLDFRLSKTSFMFKNSDGFSLNTEESRFLEFATCVNFDMMRCHAEEIVVVAIEFCLNESGQKLFSEFFCGNWKLGTTAVDSLGKKHKDCREILFMVQLSGKWLHRHVATRLMTFTQRSSS